MALGLLGCKTDNPEPNQALKITKLSKYKGVSGSDVIIYGENFASLSEDNVVKFGTELAAILSVDKAQIVVRIPSNLSKGNVKLSISTGGQSAEVDFEIVALAIHKFSPESGDMGSTVTIEGTGFLSDTNRIEVFFYTQKARILSANDSVLTVQVPNGLTVGDIKISVFQGDEVSTSKTNYQVNNVSKFWKQLDYTPATVITGLGFFSSELTYLFTIADKAYFQAMNTSADYWEYSSNTDEWKPWVSLPYEGQFLILGACSIGNTSYVALIQNSSESNPDPPLEIWSFNPNTNEWLKKNTLTLGSSPDGTEILATRIIDQINGKVYVGIVEINPFINFFLGDFYFWEFDPNSGNWVKKWELPEQANRLSRYVGNLEDKMIFRTENSVLWEFNPGNISEPWMKKAESGLPPTNASRTFKFNEQLYLMNFSFEFYQFAPANASWTFKSQLERAIHFGIGNDAYSINYLPLKRKYFLLRTSIN